MIGQLSMDGRLAYIAGRLVDAASRVMDRAAESVPIFGEAFGFALHDAATDALFQGSIWGRRVSWWIQDDAIPTIKNWVSTIWAVVQVETLLAWPIVKEHGLAIARMAQAGLTDVLWQAGIWLGTTGIAAAIKAHRGFRTVADAMRAGWKLREEIIGESKEGEEE